MEVKSIISSSTSFTSFFVAPPFSYCYLNNRKQSLLPFLVNTQRWSGVAINQKNFSFCPKAGLRWNLEAIGVPTSVPVRVAHELLAGYRYLDVTTREEFSAGHVSVAINIPYMYRVGSGMSKNPKFLEQVASHFRKYDEIIVGCQSGKRSMMVVTELLAAGYTNITDIVGGFVAWTRNGLPTEN